MTQLIVQVVFKKRIIASLVDQLQVQFISNFCHDCAADLHADELR